jgi:uncharacterized protein (TIGR03086 family)
MTWDSQRVFLEGLDFFSAVVKRVPPDAWERPSPCGGWTGRDVIGHVGAAVAFGTRLLAGEQPQWKPASPPGSHVVGDPAAWWEGLVAPARVAVNEADPDGVVDSPAGSRTVSQGLSFPAVDLFVHGWDLARTAGNNVTIPDEVVSFAHRLLDPMPAEQLRSSAVFSPEVATDASADSTASFVAWTGRDPGWQP